MREPKVMNHYGKYVFSGTPTTGVVSNNTPDWLWDETYDAIDLTCKNCQCQDDYDIEWCDDCCALLHEYLIGDWLKDDKGLYYPNPDGEYSAIVREDVTQVVQSKYTKRCKLCSPCYPGQGDLDSPDENGYLCFDLPPEIYGDVGDKDND